MEPPKKQAKVEDRDIKKFICTMQYTFFERLKEIEDKIGKITSKCNLLEEKVEAILCSVQGKPVGKPSTSMPSDSITPVYPDDTIISQINMEDNAVDNYPDGSWLGDPDNPELCIRCHITPQDLENINYSCTTPEKMSLTLLDYLFEREVQACSNLSGTGKYGKKQLNPYKIFGIRCANQPIIRILASGVYN